MEEINGAKGTDVCVLPWRVKVCVTLDSGKNRNRLYRRGEWNDFAQSKRREGERKEEKTPQTQVGQYKTK